MDESAEIGSVFKAKPELDPFYLYGLADSNYGVEDGNDEALEAIADSPSDLIRMKLARLEERRRFFQKRAEEDILETGNDDHEAVGESEEEEEDEDEQVVQGSSAVKTAASKSRSDGMDVAARISHSLSQISGVFSQVFQAFLALMEEAHIAEVSKFSPAEKSRISKRAAEFEIRLKRRTFELKQKVHLTRGAIVKLKLHPSSVLLGKDADTKLYQSLRCSQNILKSYLAYLPLSGGHLCPQSLGNTVDVMKSSARLAFELGFEAQEFHMDIKRLEAAMNKVSSRSIPGKETAPAASEDESKAKKKISLEDRKKSAALNMINNLAREKFGERFSIQSSPKKTNLRKTRMLRQKVIIPKPNKALRDRVSMAKKARQQEDSKNMFESPASRSLALEPNQSGFLRQPFFRLDDALETEEPSEAWRKTNDAVTRIELADDELTHILRYRPQDPLPVRQMETFCNPVQLICDLSVQIVDEMVRNVSKEMLNDEIVAKMMHMELKERV